MYARTWTVLLNDAINKLCLYGINDEVGCPRNEMTISENFDAREVYPKSLSEQIYDQLVDGPNDLRPTFPFLFQLIKLFRLVADVDSILENDFGIHRIPFAGF